MNDRQRIEYTLAYIMDYGGYNGAHHKQWLLDQIVQTLTTPEEYDAWKRQYSHGDDTHKEWDTGIAP